MPFGLDKRQLAFVVGGVLTLGLIIFGVGLIVAGAFGQKAPKEKKKLNKKERDEIAELVVGLSTEELKAKIKSAYRKGSFDEARRLAKQGLNLQPNDVSLLIFYADAISEDTTLAKAVRLKAALDAYRKAAALAVGGAVSGKLGLGKGNGMSASALHLPWAWEWATCREGLLWLQGGFPKKARAVWRELRARATGGQPFAKEQGKKEVAGAEAEKTILPDGRLREERLSAYAKLVSDLAYFDFQQERRNRATRELRVAEKAAAEVLRMRPRPAPKILLRAMTLTAEINERKAELERPELEPDAPAEIVYPPRQETPTQGAREFVTAAYRRAEKIAPPPGVAEAKWDALRRAMLTGNFRKVGEMEPEIVTPSRAEPGEAYEALRRRRLLRTADLHNVAAEAFRQEPLKKNAVEK